MRLFFIIIISQQINSLCIWLRDRLQIGSVKILNKQMNPKATGLNFDAYLLYGKERSMWIFLGGNI